MFVKDNNQQIKSYELPIYYLKYHRIGLMSRTIILDDAIKWEILQVILVRVWIGVLTFSGENT